MSIARKILVLAYALFYAWLAQEIERGNIAAGYPLVFVAVSTLAQILVVVGIVLYTHDPPRPFAQQWRTIFPLLVIQLAIELVMDATLPEKFNLETHGAVWLLNLAVMLVLLGPAYYLNYRVARG